MGKRTYDAARKLDWIYYYSEDQGRICCVPVGSSAANKIEEKMLKVFNGTASEAIAELEKVQKEFGLTGKFGRRKEIKRRNYDRNHESIKH